MNQLPPGFVLDAPQQGAYPGTVRDPMGPMFKDPEASTLPPGFQVDNSAPMQASAAGGGGAEPSWSETFQTAGQNMPSPMQYLESQFTNPITDVQNAYHLARGVGGKLGVVDASKDEAGAADQFLHHWGNYLSPKGIKENISQDPTGTAADILSLATPTKGLKAGGIGERTLTRADEFGAKNLKGRAAETIEAAKDSGVHFTQPFTQALSQRLREIAQKNGYREGKHTLAKSALETADTMSEGLPSFRSMHNLRQDIGDAAGSRLESERNIGMQMKTELDKVFTDLEKGTPEQIAQVVHAPPGVDAAQIGKRFKAGLTAYGAAKRMQEIQRIFDKADVHGFVWSQSGLANAIKTKFRQIYVNDKSLRKFAPDEQKLIRDIAKGNLTDFLLTLGSKAAVRGPVTAGVNAMIGGPIGGLVISGAGEVAKRALDRRQVAKVERLQHHIMNKGEGALRDAIGDTVYDHMNGTPAGKASIAKWVRTRGSKVATRGLALSIARATNRPDLFPRINAEISGIHQNLEAE